MIRINRFLGRSFVFPNGLTIGFNWMHGNGESSRTVATLASYHPPSSITWLWVLRWARPRRLSFLPTIRRGYTHRGSAIITLPLVGSFWLDRQDRMNRKPSPNKV